ncbi:unknown protein [Seminavis robusta]|uniref:Uncharacterized protein n=1 Tax=Seminavis robusta TaxID=568900 RepID=A0A9N8F364_9STRA|nr:unknown protein [Seminavis robusta]|eukprot:Sro2988_g341730.1 n/a (300) ;mRNA; f:3794-4693
MPEVTAKQFMALGLKAAGYPRWHAYKEERNIERFQAYYGAVPAAFAAIWKDLLETENENYKLSAEEAKHPINLLIAIRWTWKYETERELCLRFGIKSEKTISKIYKAWAHKVKLLFRDKLPSLEQFSDEELIFLFSIDGTHCPIEEPRPFSTDWSSFKFGDNAGVSYEIMLLIHKPQVAWVRGPIPPGAYNDIKTFKMKLMEKMETILPEKRIVGDKGYRGAKHIISTRNEFDPEEIAEWKDRVLARQESFNESIKCFKVCRDIFRHGVENHSIAFEAVLCVIQYSINEGSYMLFDPYL